MLIKEVCNRTMTYQHALARELGTIRSTLLRSGFHLGTNLHQFTQNTLKVPNWFLDNLQHFLQNLFTSGAKKKYLFTASMWVLDQYARIDTSDILARAGW